MRIARTVAGIAGLVLVAAVSVRAQEYRAGAITVVHPCARATAVRVGGAYMTLRNVGSAADRLVKVAAAAAERAEMHETTVEKGMAMMRVVAAVEIKPGATVAFRPGGLHLMLIGLKHPLKEGETLRLALTFAQAGTIDVDAVIEKAGSMCGYK